VLFSAGFMLPCLNLSSSALVVRFWNSKKRGGAGDPAYTQPVRTFLVVFAGLVGDCLFSGFGVFSDEAPDFLMTIISVSLALGYIIVTVYFFYSGILVLRSLSSANRPLKSMASYLLLVAGFTLMIITSFVMVSAHWFLLSVEAFFLNNVLSCEL